MEPVMIDARGRRCPEPLILTKQAVERLPEGASFAVLLTDATSCENVARFLRDHGMAPAASRDGDALRLSAVKAAAPLSASPEAWCAPATSRGPLVMQISSDAMGEGDDDLGRLLMKAFVNTIRESDPLPAAVVFYNGGVRLACEGSAVLPALAKLESRGVRILVCGTCLDYFQIKEKCRAGTVSNMYDILRTLAAAGSVVRP